MLKEPLSDTIESLGGGVIFLLMIMCAAGVVTFLASSYADTKRMTACVQAGKTWVRTADAPYHMECK